ncbi:nascent polypeptide-associated complex subunit alpha, muscle-specific form-like [Erinaceus europaeus]|uniref:Nascent polypeptide-associated complex subunit alpha, muscle-specific form-like n=1 Tax=Erinaceus europaeus TaxID=9365 RepID=A0ABM3VSN5_ERIEU|nr:nascent polypeptide-associated complex subunit alpha, muscle-specific form-like [Erinaceus europaeus]
MPTKVSPVHAKSPPGRGTPSSRPDCVGGRESAPTFTFAGPRKRRCRKFRRSPAPTLPRQPGRRGGWARPASAHRGRRNKVSRPGETFLRESAAAVRGLQLATLRPPRPLKLPERQEAPAPPPRQGPGRGDPERKRPDAAPASTEPSSGGAAEETPSRPPAGPGGGQSRLKGPSVGLRSPRQRQELPAASRESAEGFPRPETDRRRFVSRPSGPEEEMGRSAPPPPARPPPRGPTAPPALPSTSLRRWQGSSRRLPPPPRPAPPHFSRVKEDLSVVESRDGIRSKNGKTSKKLTIADCG